MSRFVVAVFVLCLLGLPSAVLAQVEIYWVGPAEFSYPEPWPNVVVNVGLTGPAPGPISVHYQVQEGGTAEYGTDYWGVAGTLTWAQGENQVQAVTIPLINDDIAEPTEDFFMVLDTAVGASITVGDGVQRIIILDDDGGTELPRATLVGPEDNPGGLLAVYCDGAMGETVVCGQEYEVRYGPGEFHKARIIVTPAPSETVTFDVEFGGGIEKLTPFPVDVSSSGTADIPFVRTEDDPYVSGWIRIVPQGGIAAPGPGDFHEINVLLEPHDNLNQNLFCFACFISTFIYGDCDVSLECDGTVVCGEGSEEESKKKSSESDLELLRRYRDEVLAVDSNGQSAVNLYQQMGAGLIGAVMTDPTLVTELVAARNSWVPAFEDLLDGPGTMVVTADMQSDLTLLLDRFAAVLTGDTASDLAALRNTAGLDALTGQTVSAVQTAFTGGAALPVEASTWGAVKAQFR